MVEICTLGVQMKMDALELGIFHLVIFVDDIFVVYSCSEQTLMLISYLANQFSVSVLQMFFMYLKGFKVLL